LPDLNPGPRDHLLTRALREAIAGLDPELVRDGDLDPAEAPERLARHLMAEVRRALGVEDSADIQAEQVNSLLSDALPAEESNAAEIVLPARILQGISERTALGSVAPLPEAPSTPFSQSDLLVNAEGQPNVGTELRREIASADAVDLICAFVIWSGVRQLRDALAELVERGGKLRVISPAGAVDGGGNGVPGRRYQFRLSLTAVRHPCSGTPWDVWTNTRSRPLGE
jgi:hypothetical protein